MPCNLGDNPAQNLNLAGIPENKSPFKSEHFCEVRAKVLAASRRKGKVVVKKTRPHPINQVGVISSFIVCRNQYASGDLALALGIWIFACKAHVDIKRVFCRFGFSVSDTTAHHALNSMTDSDRDKMQCKVRDATEEGEAEVGKILDNIQRYDRVF
ncbi:hypothetical protein B0H14DRAFT_2638215 [Mycena olivaceomarginata]|nr:hypothetical protein B0H14DRAFT_2638215 [Mycena olivaceomarginata]